MGDELSPQHAGASRSIVARCLYLSLDRPDVQLEVKGVCRQMPLPLVGSWKKSQRVTRDIKLNRRLVWSYKWQREQSIIDASGDSNWASCAGTRMRAIGEAPMVGQRCTGIWVSNPRYCSKVKCSSSRQVCIGTCRLQTLLLQDVGQELQATLYIDASAPKIVTEPEGMAKARHIDVK